VRARTAQGYGKGITYARRYSLCAILGVAADNDDDGNAASGREVAPPRGPPPAASAPPKPPAPSPAPGAAAMPASNGGAPIDDLEARIIAAREAISGAQDEAALVALASRFKALPEGARAAVIDAYAHRRYEIRGGK
jgi:hypothetical protein